MMVIFLPTLVWSQSPQVATQGVVVLVLRNPWPRLPTPDEITGAFNEYKSSMGKNVTITSGPRKMHVPWEKDPLYANKVVLTIRADYKSQPSQLMAVVLKYDFLSNRFKFEGVMVQGPGIHSLKTGRSTVSNLEPQDLVYLGEGWISSNPPAADVSTGNSPLTPTHTLPTKKWTVNDAVALAVEEYIRQFENTCFGRVVKLGDPAKYTKAIEQVTVITDPSKVGKDAMAQFVTLKPGRLYDPCPPNELRIPFDVPLGISIGTNGGPQPGALTRSQKQTLHHETTHEIESLHNDLRPNSDPTANRNTYYLDNLSNALDSWKLQESQVLRFDQTHDANARDSRSPESAQNAYTQLENAFVTLQLHYKPDLRNLEFWAGVRIRIEDIRNLYLSGACGEGLGKVAADYLRSKSNLHPAPNPRANKTTEPKPVEAVSPQSDSLKSFDFSHIVYAMIYDKRTGQPVEGAAFTVLRPGVTTQQWIASDFDSSLITAMGVSDNSGMVALSQSLEKGKTYSFMVARESYNVERYESLSITGTSPEPLKVTVKLTRK